MNARLTATAERINALSLRERGLLALAVLAVIFMLWDTLLMGPVRDRQQRTQTELEQLQQQVSALTSSIQTLAVERARSPDRELAQRQNALQDEVERLEQQLRKAFGEIGDPSQGLALLASLLADRSDLSLIDLENLPPESLRSHDAQIISGVFVHRVRLTVDARHNAIRAYLAMLADLPEGVFLETMHLTVPGWPKNRVELVLYSLSLDENWLGV